MNKQRQYPCFELTAQVTKIALGIFCSAVIVAPGQAAQSLEPSEEFNTAKSEIVDADTASEATSFLPQETPENTLTGQDLARFELLQQGDLYYHQGDTEKAASLYQQAKSLDAPIEAFEPLLDPTFEVERGAVKVYWREGNQGFEADLESKIIVPLTLLTQNHPEFIPGHIRLAEGHNKYDRPDEALAALERGASVYPNVLELQEALIQQQVQMKHWLPASITARQFATLNPDHERAAEFLEQSDRYQRKFRATLRENITSNTIGSVFTGALELGLTGNPFSAISPIQNAVALLRGEDSVGRSASKSFRKKLPMVEDESLNAYVNGIGQKLAAVSGREMEYEFFVVNDERLNAFALPGGKVFVNLGAILQSRSEAELAGLMAHELSHSVLSHGFQMYTKNNATGNFTEVLPFSGVFSRVAVTKYSRDLEQQADLLGTRILVKAGYAADGLENLSQSILQNPPEKKKGTWLATHPNMDKRIQYLSQLIERNGYDRYAYEGVEEHTKMQQLALAANEQLKQELEEEKLAKKSKSRSRRVRDED